MIDPERLLMSRATTSPTFSSIKARRSRHVHLPDDPEGDGRSPTRRAHGTRSRRSSRRGSRRAAEERPCPRAVSDLWSAVDDRAPATKPARLSGRQRGAWNLASAASVHAGGPGGFSRRPEAGARPARRGDSREERRVASRSRCWPTHVGRGEVATRTGRRSRRSPSSRRGRRARSAPARRSTSRSSGAM